MDQEWKVWNNTKKKVATGDLWLIGYGLMVHNTPVEGLAATASEAVGQITLELRGHVSENGLNHCIKGWRNNCEILNHCWSSFNIEVDHID